MTRLLNFSTSSESPGRGDRLAAAADKLVYRYDFGSDREHRIVLEATDFSPDDVNAGLARCP